MIAFLKGILDNKIFNSNLNNYILLIDVHGIGYEVYVSSNTYNKFSTLNSEIKINTYLQVREDAHILYGFSDILEKNIFLELIKVNSIGPKLALGILSNISIAELLAAVVNKDVDALKKLPGVGAKTASRMLIELSGLSKYLGDDINTLSSANKSDFIQSNNKEINDAISGLISLGYNTKDAKDIINNILSSKDFNKEISEKDITSSELIKLSLRKFSKI